MLIQMVQSGVIGPNASRINTYRLSGTMFDLMRVVYSALGGKQKLRFPSIQKFAPEMNIPKLVREQNRAQVTAHGTDQDAEKRGNDMTSEQLEAYAAEHAMDAETVGASLWRLSQTSGNT